MGLDVMISLMSWVASVVEYYPFGWEMPGRKFNSDQYRYGFNGKEKDQNGEWGSITNYDYGFRIYNPAIGKFLSVDPLTREYPILTPYQFASNTPIAAIDLDGKEKDIRTYSPVITALLKSAMDKDVEHAATIALVWNIGGSWPSSENYDDLVKNTAHIVKLDGALESPRIENDMVFDTPNGTSDVIRIYGANWRNSDWNSGILEEVLIGVIYLDAASPRFKSSFEQFMAGNLDYDAMDLLLDALGSMAGGGIASAMDGGDSPLEPINDPNYTPPWLMEKINTWLKEENNSVPYAPEVKDWRVVWPANGSLEIPAHGQIDTGIIYRTDGTTRDTFRKNKIIKTKENLPDGSSEQTKPEWVPLNNNENNKNGG